MLVLKAHARASMCRQEVRYFAVRINQYGLLPRSGKFSSTKKESWLGSFNQRFTTVITVMKRKRTGISQTTVSFVEGECRGQFGKVAHSCTFTASSRTSVTEDGQGWNLKKQCLKPVFHAKFLGQKRSCKIRDCASSRRRTPGKKILSAVPLFVKVIVIAIASRYFSTTRIVFRKVTKQQLQSEVQQNNSNTYCCGKFPTNRD